MNPVLQKFCTVLFYIFINKIFLAKKFAFFVNLLFLWLLYIRSKGVTNYWHKYLFHKAVNMDNVT